VRAALARKLAALRCIAAEAVDKPPGALTLDGDVQRVVAQHPPTGLSARAAPIQKCGD